MEKAVFTNMCMIYDDNGNVLVQDRLNKNWAGITFPGGHVEKAEAFVESTIREVFEETGLTINNLHLCGIKQFQTHDDERYIVVFYKTNSYTGKLKSSDEGEVFWIKLNEINSYKLVSGFEDVLKVFLDDEKNEIQYFKDNNGKLDMKIL